MLQAESIAFRGARRMAVTLAPRLDPPAKLKPNDGPARANDCALAKADGLTEMEAAELSQWLEQSGFSSVQVIRRKDHCSVHWRN
jgi:hypothetical protein